MDFKKLLERSWHHTMGNIAPLLLLTLAMIVISACSFGILALVLSAGYMESILMLIRSGREPRIGDLFAHMNLFFPLLAFSIGVAVIGSIGLVMMVLPGLLFIFFVTFISIYMLPLMTDRGMGLIDALREGFKMAFGGNIVEHAVVVLIFLFITSIGGVSLIGTLFTQPIATIFILLAYEERRMFSA